MGLCECEMVLCWEISRVFWESFWFLMLGNLDKLSF